MGRLLLLLMVAQWTCSSSVPSQRAQLYVSPPEQGPIKALVEAARFALFGSPSYHGKQHWEFDPDVAKRRSKEFQAIHGYQARALIERFGLGEDGKQEERKREQELRDIGLVVAHRK